MPLLDHFHPPLDELPWQSLFSAWATYLADELNLRWLPQGFLATERIHVGGPRELDLKEWGPSPVSREVVTAPLIFPDSFEVRITTPGGWKLVGAIELVSPGNKGLPAERRAFATRCASYLHEGASVVVLDIVTAHRANLHNEIMRLLGVGPASRLPEGTELYAAAYRPVLRQDRAEIDIWTERLALGSPLPAMPLRLTGDLFVPVEFEPIYTETCRRRRLL